MNSGNIHCTHIHAHTGTDLRTAERVEEKYEQWQFTLYSYTFIALEATFLLWHHFAFQLRLQMTTQPGCGQGGPHKFL